jgi:hypothetical protein
MKVDTSDQKDISYALLKIERVKKISPKKEG